MSSNLSARFGPWHFQPRVGFRSSFSRPWLDAFKAVTDSELREQAKALFWFCTQRTRRPLGLHLHGMFEAQLAGMNTGHPLGLPVLRSSPICIHAVTITPAE